MAQNNAKIIDLIAHWVKLNIFQAFHFWMHFLKLQLVICTQKGILIIDGVPMAETEPENPVPEGFWTRFVKTERF